MIFFKKNPGYAYITENELCLDTIDDSDWKLYHGNLGGWKDAGETIGVKCVKNTEVAQMTLK